MLKDYVSIIVRWLFPQSRKWTFIATFHLLSLQISPFVCSFCHFALLNSDLSKENCRIPGKIMRLNNETHSSSWMRCTRMNGNSASLRTTIMQPFRRTHLRVARIQRNVKVVHLLNAYRFLLGSLFSCTVMGIRPLTKENTHSHTPFQSSYSKVRCCTFVHYYSPHCLHTIPAIAVPKDRTLTWLKWLVHLRGGGGCIRSPNELDPVPEISCAVQQLPPTHLNKILFSWH